MRIIAAVALCLLAVTAQAAAPCFTTPRLYAGNYPGAGNIPSGNNLLAPAGKAVEAGGQRLVLIGRLFDNRCIPIIGATVEIWQADPYGKWLLASGEDKVNPNPVFAGAGRTYTDNGGAFFFTTAFPAALKNRAPYINIRVKVRGMQDFSTVLYFANDARNGTDSELKKLKSADQSRVMLEMGQMADAGYSGMITMVMPYQAPYRGY